MGIPEHPISLSLDQVRALNSRLSDLRHDTNNHVALVLAAIELIRHKPSLAPTVVESLAPIPQKIVEEIRGFSDLFETTMGIERD